VIYPKWLEPCACEACRIAGVADRRRPFAECHGRELLKWWLEYERFQFGVKRALKPMPNVEDR
jgi:hypothetical protein